MNRIPELDGLRGIAVILVMADHFARDAFAGTSYPLIATLFRMGWIGLPLFFVLSGYLITGGLIRDHAFPGALRRFYLRRVLRIWPLYLTACFLLLVVLPLTPLVTGPEVDLARSVQPWYWLHATNLLAMVGTLPFQTGHFWSLSVEEQFYLVWPLLVFRLKVQCLPRALALGLAVITLAWILAVFAHHDGLRIWLSPGLYALPLAGGCWLAWQASLRDLRELLRPARIIGLVGLPGVALLSLLGDGRLWAVDVARVVVAVLGVAAIVLALGTGALARLCGSPWLIRLGVISYGLYVIHNPLRSLLPRIGLPVERLTDGGLLERLTYVGIMGLATYLLASLSWRYLETRFQRLKERVGAPQRAHAIQAQPG